MSIEELSKKADEYVKNNIVDDSEMNELMTFEKDIKAGIEDIKTGRYKIIG